MIANCLSPPSCRAPQPQADPSFFCLADSPSVPSRSLSVSLVLCLSRVLVLITHCCCYCRWALPHRLAAFLRRRGRRGTTAELDRKPHCLADPGRTTCTVIDRFLRFSTRASSKQAGRTAGQVLSYPVLCFSALFRAYFYFFSQYIIQYKLPTAPRLRVRKNNNNPCILLYQVLLGDYLVPGILLFGPQFFLSLIHI